MPTDKEVKENKAMDNQEVKKLADVLRKNCEENNCHALGVGCPDCQAVAINDYLNSHPSSQSLKRIETIKLSQIMNDVFAKHKVSYGDILNGRVTTVDFDMLMLDFAKTTRDKQYAADQPVVAEKDAKIAELTESLKYMTDTAKRLHDEKEALKAQLQPEHISKCCKAEVDFSDNKQTCKKCGKPCGVIYTGKVVALSQLQPVPDEEVEKQLFAIIERFLKDFDNESHEYPISFLVSNLSALIKSRTGKVAGEIFSDVEKFLDIDEDPDGGYVTICNHRQYSDYKALKARYSPESER